MTNVLKLGASLENLGSDVIGEGEKSMGSKTPESVGGSEYRY